MRGGVILQRLNMGDNRGYGEGCSDAGSHAPEVTVAIETPPIPLEDVGSCVSAPEARDDPGHDIADGGDEPADTDAQQNNDERGDIAEAHVGAGSGVGIDEALID